MEQLEIPVYYGRLFLGPVGGWETHATPLTQQYKKTKLAQFNRGVSDLRQSYVKMISYLRQSDVKMIS